MLCSKLLYNINWSVRCRYLNLFYLSRLNIAAAEPENHDAINDLVRKRRAYVFYKSMNQNG